MSNPFPIAPPPPVTPGRPWYKKKRFIIPIGSFVALVAIGSAIPSEEDATVNLSSAAPTTTLSAPTTTTEAAPVTSSSVEIEQARLDAEAKAAENAKKKAEAKAKAKARAAAKADAKRRAEAAAKKAAARRAAAKPKPKPVTAYYANCTAVRAAGAAPIYAGQPGYSRKLDRDGDGVACE